MAVANYLILGELFGLLERIELIDGVGFHNFDPDDESDVELIASRYIGPALSDTSQFNRDMVASTIAFYSLRDLAEIQNLKDNHQELTLPDSESWPVFFHRIGKSIFGDKYRDRYDETSFEEVLDEQVSGNILRPEVR